MAKLKLLTVGKGPKPKFKNYDKIKLSLLND